MILCLFILNSCETREDFNKNLDQPPAIAIRKDDSNFVPLTSYESVLADSFKIAQKVYRFDFQLTDPLNLTNINVSPQILGYAFAKTSPEYANGYLLFPTATGYPHLILTATDKYGLSSKAQLMLTVFKNIPPIANLKTQNTAILDPREYLLDATGSYDGDAKFGGKLCNYQFNVSPSYKVTTTSPTIDYIFPAPGNYLLSLRVQDNDSAWSPSATLYLTVN